MKSKEDNTQKKTKKLSSKELSWIINDVGNSAFVMMVSTFIPIYFINMATASGISAAK